jgi:hypothetical protein
MNRILAAGLFLFAPLISVTSVAFADEAAPTAGAAPDPTSERSEHHGSAYVDALGFLMFGPRIGVDAGSARLTGGVYGRWFDPGLLGRSLFLKTGDSFAFSYGVGARGRFYFAPGHGGFHLGAGAEYLRTRIENAAALVVTTSGYFIPYAEAGYRFAFQRFYAGVSAALGYAARLSGRVDNLPGGNSAGSYQATNESSVYGTAGLELGVFF